MTAATGASSVGTRARIRLMLGVLMLCAASCSRVRLNSDHDAAVDFTRLRTWDWAAQSGELETPAAIKTSERIRLDSVVRAGVEAALSRKGYVRDRETADFRVAWAFGEWTLSRSGGKGFRYGAVGLYYPGLHAANTRASSDGRALPASADPYSTEYEEAKLDIVMIDGKTERVIWHGNATDKSDFGFYTAAQTKQVGEAVAAILQLFPPTVP